MDHIVHEEDGRGGSLTRTVEVELVRSTVVEETTDLLVSVPYQVASMTFVQVPDGVFDSEFHRAPCEQFIVVLSGRLRTETTDGTVTELGPGDVVLVRDVSGTGHKATVVDAPLRIMFIALPDT